jgi:hypothetical protein
VETAVHDVTQWLLAHGNFDPFEKEKDNGRSCIYHAVKAIGRYTIGVESILDHGMFWHTLAYLAPFFGTTLVGSVYYNVTIYVNTRESFFYRRKSVPADYAWWFLDACVPYMRAHSNWATDMFQGMEKSNSLFLDTRIRLAAYLIRCSAKLPHHTNPNLTLHLLVTAMRDCVLATQLLCLPESLLAELAPIAATWPAHAWMCHSLVDGSEFATPFKADEAEQACGAHLWYTWSTGARLALGQHMIPDLADMTLGFLKVMT